MTRSATERRVFWRFVLAYLILAVAFICYLFWPRSACAATITGKIQVAGSPFSGSFRVSLSYPSVGSSTLQLPGLGLRHYVTSGSFTPFDLPGNDTLSPRGTYYLVTYLDSYGSEVASIPYYVSGATFDLGSAIPLPITTANVSFSDLIGLRTVSVQNLTVTGTFSFPSGYLAVSGLTGVKNLVNIRFADGWRAGSTTCGIQEAVSDLPATGGLVYLSSTPCSVSVPVTLSKPLTLQGHGIGVSLLTSVTGGPALTATGTFSGLTLRDFSVTGQTAQPGISLGGTLRNVRLDNVGVYGSLVGLAVPGSVSGLTLTGSRLDSNGTGISLSGSVSGVSVSSTSASSNSGAGISSTGATGNLDVSGASTVVGNGGAGVLLASGTTARLTVSGGTTLSGNAGGGVVVSGGASASVSSADVRGGGTQPYGLNLTATGIPVSVSANQVGGNTTADFAAVSGASLTVLPQAGSPTVADGGGAVSYFYPAPSRVCNSSGCSVTAPDGTISQWGRSPAVVSSGPEVNTSVVFPKPFTTTTNLVVTSSPFNAPNPSTSKPIVCYPDLATLTTTGVTLKIALPTEIGGGGASTPTQSITCGWTAYGN